MIRRENQELSIVSNMKHRKISIPSIFLHLGKLILLPIEEESGNNYRKRTNAVKIIVGLVY